jgi:hypothetical protein
MSNVFLSYSQENVEQALLIEHELTSLGLTVWRDQEQLRAGERWPKVLGERIAAAHAVLLLWSQDAAASTFVELEWTTALALKKAILPYLVDQTPLPPSLAALQAVSSADVSQAAVKIIKAVSHDQSLPGLKTNKEQVIDQLARIRSTNASDVLKEFREVHGGIYQAAGDIYIGTSSPPKSALDKGQAWVAIMGLLTAFTLAAALWHNYAALSVTTSEVDPISVGRGGKMASAQIVSPTAGEPVDANVDIRGTSKNVGAARKVWVVVESKNSSYYPHKSAAEIAAGNEWHSTGCVGSRQDFDKQFEILAIVADEAAQAILQEEGKNVCEEAFHALPTGAEVLFSITVSRKPRWSNEPR